MHVVLCTQTPSVHFGGSWVWCHTTPLATEDVWSVAELGSVLRTYGRMVATMGAPATRFRLLATANGHAVGVYEWSWDTALRAPRPSAEPFLLWPTPRTLRAWSEPEVVKAS